MMKSLVFLVICVTFLDFSFGETISVEWTGKDNTSRILEIETDQPFNGTLKSLYYGENKLIRGSKIIFEEKKLWESEADDAIKNVKFQKLEKFFSEYAKVIMTESIIQWEEKKIKVKHFFYVFDGDDGLYCRYVLEPEGSFELIRIWRVDHFDHLGEGLVKKNHFKDKNLQGWSEWSFEGAPFSLSQIYISVPGWYSPSYWKNWTDWDIDIRYKATQHNILYNEKKFLFDNPIRFDFAFFPSSDDDPSSSEAKGSTYYEQVIKKTGYGLDAIKGKNIKDIIFSKGHIKITAQDLPFEFEIKCLPENQGVFLFIISEMSKKPEAIYILKNGKKEMVYNSSVLDIWKDEKGYNTAFFLKTGSYKIVVEPEKPDVQIKQNPKYVVFCGSNNDKEWDEGEKYGCVKGKVYLGWATSAPGVVDFEKIIREDSEKVIYRFTGFDENKNYKVRLGFYNENDEKRLRITIGKVSLGDVVLPVEKITYFEKEIPKEGIINGIIDLVIEVINGAKALISKIWIFEE